MGKFDTLNDKQTEAVKYTEGPLLILAGAGSGKTRVLTHRIAYLIEEMGVSPWNIMAITFTNKAAKEMKDRVEKLVDFGGDSVWVTTFHSTCVRILRRHIDYLGYDTDFTIYDTDDQKTVIKHILKEMDLDPKMYKDRALLSKISTAKNELQSPEEMMKAADGNFRGMKEATIYAAYQKKLKSNNALDFDDLLMLTVQLFQQQKEILEYYQDRFRYIMVDEYQDTNNAQFQLIYLLSGKYKNLCVVGDDDQSIYRFRGADIRNILDFERAFPGTKVVKLEQNYRSSTNILDVANAVISHNRGRKEKALWSKLGAGVPVTFRQFDSGYEEAENIIREIRQNVAEGDSYNDYAILYRTNAQSRAFEEKCIAYNVPYRMVGGVNFYQRQEIKDILAYLKTVATAKDDVAVRRILNVPKRGIGQSTMEKVQAYADQRGCSFFDALCANEQIPGLGRVATKLNNFTEMIQVLRSNSRELSFESLIEKIIDRTDYYSTLDEFEEEKQVQKKENIQELISKAADFETQWEGEHVPLLTDFLEEVALVADVDSLDTSEERIVLMTLHGSKGLEFPKVYLCGMEEGLFPSYMSMNTGDPADVEEERRLCYVGMTRAMKQLTLTCAKMRTIRGETQYNMVSRFVSEIPKEIFQKRDSVPEKYIYKEPDDKKKTLASNASFGKDFVVQKSQGLSYAVGDRVNHIKFGEGTVMEIEEGKKDFEVTVDFDSVGEKRMFASFAKLTKVE